jgi:hypothetical protein
VITAIGMLFEIASGSELYPTLTGPIVLLVAAAIVALRDARWTAYIGLTVPLVLGIGLVVSTVMSPTFLEQLIDFGDAGIVAGSIAHVVGLVAAVAGGFGMILGANRRGDDEVNAPVL